jgi:hypothetical protein
LTALEDLDALDDGEAAGHFAAGDGVRQVE